MQSFILKNGKIFDGNSFIENDIIVENGWIVHVGKVKDINFDCFDVSGCIITSGLVDIHTHLSEMGNKEYGFPADLATIPFGVLYAIDACALKPNLKLFDNLFVETKVFVPLIISGADIDYNEMYSKLSLFGNRVIGIKVFFDENQDKGIGLGHLKSACRLARERNLKIMVHSSFSPVPMIDIINALQKGDILTHAYHGGNHTIDENEYIAYKTAKNKGVFIDAGMAGGVHTDFNVLRKAIEANLIPDTISSDITNRSAYVRGGVYGLTMCMSIYRELGMEESKIFQATTKNAAIAAGQKSWFSLTEGNLANISVIKYEKAGFNIVDRNGNRVESEKGYKCKMTVKNGQIIYRS